MVLGSGLVVGWWIKCGFKCLLARDIVEIGIVFNYKIIKLYMCRYMVQCSANALSDWSTSK